MKNEEKDLKINEAEALVDSEFIARFMQLQTRLREWDERRVYLYGNLWHLPEKLKYETSWDWIMPVVSKIAEYRMAHPKQTGWVCDCKIVVYQRVLYREVVNFCKWFIETQGAEG